MHNSQLRDVFEQMHTARPTQLKRRLAHNHHHKAGKGSAMRTRSSVLAAVLCGLVAVAAPSAATAAPHHNRYLTIATSENPIVDGQGVLIYGQLKGVDVGGQTVYLYHRVVPASGFTIVQKTTTNSTGYYEFARADGVVASNRDWFVRGPNGSHSRTVFEKVDAAVTLSESASSTDTKTPVTFTGTVAPNHPYQKVEIQEQSSVSGSGWATVAKGLTNAASAFSITKRFAVSGDETLRAYFPRDPRNFAGSSDSVTLSVQQAENPAFTINTSAPVINDGASVTISGALSTSNTDYANVPVTLYGRSARGALKAIASTTTNASGDYSFDQTPRSNTVYVVRTTGVPHVRTVGLYQGVADVVSMSASTPTAQEGQAVTFSGSVTPDHAGHWIYLQQQTQGGSWQDIAGVQIGAGSNYAITYRFGQPGTFNLRARIFGGPENIGGASAPVSETVTGVAAASSLPTAS
jgi:hypothetical protein